EHRRSRMATAPSVHRRESLIVVTRIVRLPRSLLDHDALGPAVLPGLLWIDVVLAIRAARQPALAVRERAAADVAPGRLPLPLLDLGQHVARLLGNLDVARDLGGRAGGQELSGGGRR